MQDLHIYTAWWQLQAADNVMTGFTANKALQRIHLCASWDRSDKLAAT